MREKRWQDSGALYFARMAEGLRPVNLKLHDAGLEEVEALRKGVRLAPN